MTQPTQKKRLLLVDDSEINIIILSKILQKEYELLTAYDGQAAMDILNSADNDSIAAVILDIVMPVMDGFEVLSRMRSDSHLRQLPVIVSSGQDSQPDSSTEIRALSMGANDYVNKPYNPDILKHRIANAIYLHETAAFVNTVQHDSLTGLYSKEYFYLQVEEILRQNPNSKYDVICCDIERFKLVNDLYGTSVGNELLKWCADIFKVYLGKNGICGRIRADVFACLIESQMNYDPQRFVEIGEAINQFHINLQLQLKYGICRSEDPSVPASILCDRALIAVSSIKGKYGVYFKIYDGTIRKKMIDEQYITSHMKQALENGEFEVSFQPKYELRTETIVGAEALVRWNNPDKGYLSPGEFIPLFEKNGFITDLDKYVWEICCQKIRAWIDQRNIAIPVSMNVSRADIYNPQLDKIFLSLLRKYNLSPTYFYLEITESAYTKDSQQLIDTVTKLKKIGFKIEMDDFGTGYSSLNMLSELPIDIIKLDIGFLQHHEKLNSRSILSFIISLAKWMNLGVVAEGVETAEQVTLLRSLACDIAQGFYYARPMPADQFEELLLKQFEKRGEIDLLRPNYYGNTKIFHASSILVMDERKENYAIFSRLFSDKYEVVNLLSASEMISMIKQRQTDIGIVLYMLGTADSAASLREVVSCCSPYEIPVVTILNSIEDADIAMNAGAVDYIVTPFCEAAAEFRINSIIASIKASRFNVENEINSAILDMKKRAEQDSLTGLLNRAEFENKVEEFFRNNSDPSGYFVMFDIDNFKNINDTYGHATGDNALQAVAHSLHSLFPETEIIGRIGGDEFSMLIPYAAVQEELELKVRKLCCALDFRIGKMILSCSAGICLSPKNGLDFQSLYENADIALLQAKRNGKSQYCIYHSGMETPMDEKMEQKAMLLLDNASDALFVCDAVTSELIYINDTACDLIGKSKVSCLGARCYQLFWDRSKHCDRCGFIEKCTDCFYEENTVLKDGKTSIHIKAKMDVWDGRRVKIHYLQR